MCVARNLAISSVGDSQNRPYGVVLLCALCASYFMNP